ncbi:autotransporter domain-containing protein [Pseudovibrio denitrificans]|uniref:autotransporter family protein n=1 Tax=Pseudovibrio denitrificans TaxID=258256 RepID=UPI0039BEF213
MPSMKPYVLFKSITALPVLLLPHSLFAGEVLNDGSVTAESPTVTTQVSVADGTTLEVQSGASVEVGTAHAIIDAVDGTSITVINAGSISTTDDRYDAINAQNSTLTLENTGLIHGLEDAIDIGSADLIINSGTILGGDEGIIAQDRIEELINSGSITGERDDGIQARSIGSLTNSGSITSVEDDGILVLGAQGIGSLINSGTISADEEAVDADALGYFENTGTISASRDAIFIDGDAGTIINHGTINSEFGGGFNVWSADSVVNTGTIISNDEGIYLDGEDGSGHARSVYNSGTIESQNSGIRATSIERLTNTGSITSHSSAIRIHHGTIVNSGTLTGSREAAIIFTHETDGDVTLINSGVIQNDFSPTNSAIEFGPVGSNHLVLQPGSVIIGTILYGGTGSALTVENGLSIANTFIGTPQQVEANGAAFAVSGNQVAVADTSGLAAVNNAFVDLSASISDGVNARIMTNLFDGAGEQTPRAEPQRHFWMSAFGAGSRWKGTGATTHNTHGYGGVLMGLDGQISEDQLLGAFLGTAYGRAEVSHDSQETDITSFYGGLYGLQQVGAHSVSFVLTGGYSDYDSERSIANNTVATGTETASADYGAWFIAPEITLATELSVLEQTVLPSLTLRYAGAAIQSFSESGSDGNLSVDERALHEFTGRAQLTARAYGGTAFSLDAFVALEGRLSRGDDNLTGALLGQDIGFVLDDRDEALRGTIGFNAGGQITPSARWFARAEAATGSDVDVHGEGQAGFLISF